MSIAKTIESFKLLYYEYDKKRNILILDNDYSNRYTKLELTKITYYLSKKNIEFDVINNGAIIRLGKKSFNLIDCFKRFYLNIKNQNQNIYLLNDNKVKYAKNIPLFKINYLDKQINLLEYDCLIFTSKNAVKAINKINKEWKKLPSFAISQQTGKLIKHLNGNLEYVSSTKHGDEFSYEIIDKLKNKKVLYLRGNKIVSNIDTILKENQIDFHENIVYENNPIEFRNKPKLAKNSKIIFTSPSTIKYFLQNFSWEKSYTAICIGKTTASFFPEYIKPIVAPDTSLKSCVQKALELK